MNIAMIGTGYVGLTTGACLASLGHTVTCYDSDPRRIMTLRGGRMPIYESGLDQLVARQRRAGRLRFSSRLDNGLGEADLVFLAVGTPSRPNGEIDLSQVMGAASDVAPFVGDGTTLVIKSTVTAGTCRNVRTLIARKHPRLDISVASNPEFLREGSALADFNNPDRIVIGADDDRSREHLLALYAPFIRTGTPALVTDTANAELIKHAANAFLAMKIVYANELASLCEALGGDVASVAAGIGMDHRIGPEMLRAGPGYGGSCFPKDTAAFAALGRAHGVPQRLIEAATELNHTRMLHLARRVIRMADLRPRDTVAVLGVAFKASTDDVRESPALKIIAELRDQGLAVRAHDPKAMRNAAPLLPDIVWADSAAEACLGADAVVVLTEWPEYAHLDLRKLGTSVRRKILFDYRNLFDPDLAAASGWRHVGIGRPPRQPAQAEPKRAPAAGIIHIRRQVAAPR